MPKKSPPPKEDDKNFSYVVLTLDPATSTGWCLTRLFVVGGVYSKAEIFAYGFIDVKNDTDFVGDALLYLMKKLRKLIVKNDVRYITVEDYFFSRKTCTGSNLNPAFRTAIHILARQMKLEYMVLNISSWKNFVSGRRTPTKEQKKKWGAEKAKKNYIQQALWERYDIRFPNHSISEKTGKPVKFRSDVVDAVAMAIYYAGMFHHIRDFVCTVPVPEDFVWKKVPKGMFEY